MKLYRFIFWFVQRCLRDQRSETGMVARVALSGLVIGVSVLVIVLSIVNGFQKELQSNVLSNLPQAQILFLDGLSQSDQDNLADLRGSGLEAIAPFLQRSGLVAVNERVVGVTINGVEPDSYRKISSVFERFSFGDGHRLAQIKFSIVLGVRIAKSLGVGVGDHVTLVLPDLKSGFTGSAFRRKKFTVIDIFETGTLLDTNHIYISLEDAKALFRENRAQGFHGKLNDLFDSSSLWPFFLKQFGDRVYSVTTWVSTNGNLYKAIAVQKMTMFVLLFFLVGVAAFNLVSGMVMIVEHRKGDIAILISMGAGSRLLATLFCLMGLQLCLMGTALGLILGVCVASVLPSLYGFVSDKFDLDLMGQYFISYLPVEVQIVDLIWVFSITLVIGLLASIYPAHRASKVYPGRVLAHE